MNNATLVLDDASAKHDIGNAAEIQWTLNPHKYFHMPMT